MLRGLAGMERHFKCTACGKCCFGWLPLTLDDALAHAGRFPLGMVWTPLRQGHKAFKTTARLGATITLRDRRQLALRLVPTSYIPPSLACPELGADNLCGIQESKPSRCRAMPFFPYVDEADQAPMLVPRKGWQCDVSEAAPVVYRDKAILDRIDFDREAAQLKAQAPVLRAYAEALVPTVPGLLDALVKSAAKPVGGDVLLSFATLLPRLDGVDVGGIARAQLPVLHRHAELTADRPELVEYHRRYREWIADMERLSRRHPPK
ncbi:MAG TPA: YkgJ family cysteine cluster protein [Candidatus Omnitrophota bacterium]|nr:YkgJ family cysteine cluster protein [Candidatus Omnitrophota bacterium]